MNKPLNAIMYLLISLVLLPVIIGAVAGIDPATLSASEVIILGLFSTLYLIAILVGFVKMMGITGGK